MLQLATVSIPQLRYAAIDFFIVALFVASLKEKFIPLLLAVAFAYGVLLDMFSLGGWGLTSIVVLASLLFLKFLEKNFSLRLDRKSVV